MKQHNQPSFEKSCKEALDKARQLNDLPRIEEAVRRAAFMIAIDPQSAEQMFADKIKEGKKL